MKKIFKSDIFIRAFKTFIQGFLASFVVFLNNNITFDKTMLKSSLIGALAGGISAVMNYVIQLLDKGGK